MAKDIWNKVLNGEKDKFYLSYRCQSLLKKKVLTQKDLRNCQNILSKESKMCLSLGSDRFPSIFPRLDCEELSENLISSKLKTDYQDCPGLIENSGITNIFRIISHFSKQNKDLNTSNCAANPQYLFAKMNMDYNDSNAWPLNICYRDSIKAKDVCYQYIPGFDGKSEFSETKIVAKILKREIGSVSPITCKIVEKRKYNPARLAYKTGCFIVFDAKKCNSTSCDKKVYFKNKVRDIFKYKGTTEFEYFTTTFQKENLSMSKVLEVVYKLDKRSVKNLTDAEFFLKQKKNGIIHGIGCSEDLLPRHFPRKSLNQCTPLPFIIDGVKVKDDRKFLTIRTAIDDVHTPRSIKWNYIFGALSTYQQFHPLKQWTLYGYFKN